MAKVSVPLIMIVSGMLLLGLGYSCVKGTTPPHTPPTDSTTKPNPDSTTTPPATDTVNLRAGLLLWLPFDGNMADSSGNGNPTTALNGASLTFDEHGYANQAFGANGTNQVILVTNNGSIRFDSTYSISVNFMTLDTFSRHAYVTMIDWNNGYAPSFELANSVPGLPSRFDVGVNDSVAGCDNIGTGPGATNKLNDTTTFVPEPGSWYNGIVTYYKGSIKVYINGQLVSAETGPGTTALNCPASSVVIGGWWSGDPENLDGKVDDIRIYNRVLNAKEIARLAKRFQEHQ
jgi:hypothetical protein